MTGTDIICLARLCLSAPRLQAPAAALPSRAAAHRTRDNCHLRAESAIETACDLSCGDGHGARATMRTTSAPAVGGRLPLVDWAAPSGACEP